MRADIKFPIPCALCLVYLPVHKCPAGIFEEEGEGHLSCACKRLYGRVRTRLKKTKGIAPRMLQPGERNTPINPAR